MAIVGYSYLTAPPQSPKVSQIPAPSRPLHKPVPLDILSQPGLSLSPSQKEKVEGVDKEWQKTRAGLETTMAGYQPRQGRLDQVQGQLASYSGLSRQFETARIKAWDKALSVLDAEQKKQVAR